MIKSDLHYSLNAHSINVSHGKVLDSQVLQDNAEKKKKMNKSVHYLNVYTPPNKKPNSI